MTAFMTAISIACAILAFSLFGLSTDAHHLARLGGRPRPERRRMLRTAAWTAVALAFPFAILARGWIYGPIAWFGALMFGAGAVFLYLNLVPAKAAANAVLKQRRPS